MTKEDIEILDDILRQPRFKHSTLLEAWRARATVTEEPASPGTRTLQQNNALHLNCSIIADKLNSAGKDMRLVLKPSYLIPWSTESVKEHLWRPIMKALYGLESTKSLNKTGQIDHIHETLMRELGRVHHIEWHDFPHDKGKTRETMGGYKSDDKAHLSAYYGSDDVTPKI
jgi:hypothetical protein